MAAVNHAIITFIMGICKNCFFNAMTIEKVILTNNLCPEGTPIEIIEDSIRPIYKCARA